MNDNEILADHEQRLKKIEDNYTNDINKILGILEQIQVRLVGSIDSDAPGLLTEVKQLEKEYVEIKAQLGSIDLSLKEVNGHFIPIKQIIEDISVLKTKMENFSKHRYVAYGIIIAISWLLTNLKSLTPFIPAP